MRHSHALSKSCGTVAAAVALALLAASPAWAHTSRPDVTSFAISGARPEATAGVIKLKLAVHNAKTCVMSGPSSVIGARWYGSCSSRAQIVRVWIPENASERAVTYRLHLVARGKAGTSSRTLTITIPGEPKFDAGAWDIVVESNPPIEIEFLADGQIVVPSEPTTSGSWTYHHRLLRFVLTASGSPDVVIFEASGPAGGPLTGDASLEGKMIPIKLERLP